MGSRFERGTWYCGGGGRWRLMHGWVGGRRTDGRTDGRTDTDMGKAKSGRLKFAAKVIQVFMDGLPGQADQVSILLPPQ